MYERERHDNEDSNKLPARDYNSETFFGSRCIEL